MTIPATDAIAIEGILQRTCDEALRFLAGLSKRPVNRVRDFGPASTLPEAGLGAAAALDHLMGTYGGAFTGSAGPRFLGFVTGGSTPAALAGDWLTSTFDQNASDRTSDAADHIERSAITMLRALLGLPDTFSGRFVTGATMSNLVGLAIGRQWWGRQLGVDIAQQGAFTLPPLVVLSGSPHSTAIKALSILGIGRGAATPVPTVPNREAVDVDALRDALRAQSGRPCVVIANAGVVNTGDFDDLAAIAALRHEFPFYLHIDAAFGGIAACSPRFRPLLAGWDAADSIAVDVHKWLNVPYDSGVQLTRHRDLQVEVFQNTGAAYLGAPNGGDALHLTPETSRRLRALPVWMTLMAYGAEGYRAIVEENCRCASMLGHAVEGSPHFRLLAPVGLNIVAFTLREPGSDREAVDAFLRRLRAGGRTFLTATTLDGVAGFRAAFSNWRTTADDVDIVWRALNDALTAAEPSDV